MSVRELAFTDREGLYGVLGIASGLSAQFRKFQWLMPTFLDPADFITGAALWSMNQRIVPRDMTRVVNVKLENALRTKQEGLELRDRREILDQVFTLRPQHVTEYF
ncbi:hypothetical protein AGMMS49546_38410 [Spirochaetia bacterium]|nr:hypothetical protein AGMMS49546_38410 [Spirochaetia bacterium]